jgi:acyl carrier protein
MKSRQQIFELLSEILANDFELATDQLSPAAELTEDLDLDSIDAIDIAVRLEEATGVRAQEEQLKTIRKLDDIVEIIYSGLASPPA